jgi:hypothetical protein
MFSRFKAAIQRRQAQSYLENVHGWYQICDQVTGICGQVLHDESVRQRDIGVPLDKTDRMLFALRNYNSEARRLLHRQDPALARRLDETSSQVFNLRNETARFLIRLQGPGSLLGGQSDDSTSLGYYNRALQDVGFNARRLHSELEGELIALWTALQSSIDLAEKSIQHV